MLCQDLSYGCHGRSRSDGRADLPEAHGRSANKPKRPWHPVTMALGVRTALPLRVVVGVDGDVRGGEVAGVGGEFFPPQTQVDFDDDRIAFEKPWRKNTRIKIKSIGKLFGDWELMEEYITRKQRGW